MKDWERRWTEFVRDGLKRRLLLTTYYAEHPEEREKELERCAQDPVHWINNWAWTYDPRIVRFDGFNGHVPLHLWPKQEELVRWVHERATKGEDGLVEKSRGQGASWILMAYGTHQLLFRPGFSMGVGSRKEEYVDDAKNLDALLPKARYIIQHLPRWMKEALQTNRIVDRYMKLVNPRINSSITGEAGDNIGRGGRKTLYYVDEHAHIQRADRVEAALTGGNTDCIIRVSTPNGPANAFARLAHTNGIHKFRLHWSDNPLLDEDWYKERCIRISDPVIIAQELDINYTASVEGIIIQPAWAQAAVNLRLPLSNTPPVAGLDVGTAAEGNTVLVIRQGPNVLAVEQRPGTTDFVELASWVVDQMKPLGCRKLHFDASGVGAGIGSIIQELFEVDAIPVNTGSKSEDERFLNLRAALWWSLRDRFVRTFRYVQHREQQEPEKLISLPNHQKLLNELTSVRALQTVSGRIKIESKVELERRGVPSPDYADALVLAFADDVTLPPPQIASLEVLEEERNRAGVREYLRERYRRRGLAVSEPEEGEVRTSRYGIFRRR